MHENPSIFLKPRSLTTNLYGLFLDLENMDRANKIKPISVLQTEIQEILILVGGHFAI